jgi:endonuclease-8
LPEGHTLHRLSTELTAAFGGQAVASSSPQGRFREGAARVDGRVLTNAEAYGKHLLVTFDGLVDQVHVHLGLYGSWLVGPARPVVGQVRWRLADVTATADLRGPTACELLDPGAVEMLLGRLGPDPLRADADPDRAWRCLSSSRTSVAALLMNQRVLAGVGNVYRAEILFRHAVDPATPGRELDASVWAAMWADLVALMRSGERTGRIDTVRPEHEPDAMGREPRVDDHGGEVYVYRRADLPCLVCQTPIRRQVLAGRNLFWCPVCQAAR